MDKRVVGIVLTGAGHGFCAGMDISALDQISASGDFTIDTAGLEAEPGDPMMGEDFAAGFTYILSLRKPLLAAINGPCAGLGFCFALLCDMRFVVREAKFSTAFSQRGLVAEHGMSWLLPRLIGSSRALDLLWSARKFDGVEAERLGLADRLCEPGTALECAREYITDIADIDHGDETAGLPPPGDVARPGHGRDATIDGRKPHPYRLSRGRALIHRETSAGLRPD